VDLGAAARRSAYADSSTTDDETYDYSQVT
jgi:hypothetical protein